MMLVRCLLQPGQDVSLFVVMMICSPAKVVVGCVLNSPAMVFVRLVFKQPGHGLCSLSV